MRQPEQDRKNQQRYNSCGKIVGCDQEGRKRKCECKKVRRKMEEKYLVMLNNINADNGEPVEIIAAGFVTSREEGEFWCNNNTSIDGTDTDYTIWNLMDIRKGKRQNNGK